MRSIVLAIAALAFVTAVPAPAVAGIQDCTPPGPTDQLGIALDVPSACLTLKSVAFHPKFLVVSVGTTLTWTNLDPVTHTVTSNTGDFDSGFLASGSSFTHTFAAQGAFSYHCNVHPGMQGTIVVVPL
ncbi:MAG: cupredoxin domain-containing protein [Thermoplasmatota archaeon]